jgi:hypothetical protein
MGLRPVLPKHIPDEDDIARHCAASGLEKGDDGVPRGVTAKAFKLRENEEGFSHQWLQELSVNRATSLILCQDAVEATREIKPKDGLAILAVRAVRGLRYRLNVQHEPILPDDLAHAEVVGFVAEDGEEVAEALALLAMPIALPKAPKKKKK